MAAQQPPGLDASDLARRHEIVVVGAGLVGLAAALRLGGEGKDVLVLDRQGVAAEASRGNAGAFAFSDIFPLASPGIIRQAPKWLLDPLGPLSIPPAYLPVIAPWLWRFWRASQPRQVAAGTEAQAGLMRLAVSATSRLVEKVRANDLLHPDGNLHLYDGLAPWQRSLPNWEVRARHGIEFKHLHGADALAQLQPGLHARFKVATFVPGWMTVRDPLVFAQRIADAVGRASGEIRQADVHALRPQPGGVQIDLGDGRTLMAGQVIVAAGAWSHTLALGLGDRIPLETERGYNTTLPPGALDLRRQVTFMDHGFVMTPIGGGVRVGGAVEMAGLKAPPNWARAQALLDKAKLFFPGLRVEGGTRWMGFRPSLPDSLPVIGRSAADDRVTYAFGHGHLGLTQAAATAELVLALVTGARPAIDLAPFRPGRFR